MTLEIQKILYQLEPKYRELLTEYLQYLIYLQNQKSAKPGDPENKILPGPFPQNMSKRKGDAPERLRILRQYRGIAPKPHFPVSKYDVYEQ